MSLAWPLALALAAVSAMAMLRIGRRRPGIVLLQPVIAALLYFTLLPPASEQRAGTLVIATADTTARQLAEHRGEGPQLALPEAPALPDVEAVPDLATALRRHPDLAKLRVLGAGLGARDREAVGSRALAFDASPLPAGLVALSVPSAVTVGSRWTVSGRVQAMPGAKLELHDPSGRLLLAAAPDAHGNFSLQAVALTQGRVEYRLDLLALGKLRETLALPMQVQAGRRAKIWLLSGGPGPELKYLQRWALDAGLDLRSQASLGGGLHVGDTLPPFDAQALSALDLLVIDERAWRELGPARRRLLREAVDQGLGLLLRITGPMSAAERAELRESGFILGNDEGPLELALDDTAAPLLLRQPLSARAMDGLPLLRDARGHELGLWRAQGRGRIGLWWLGESYRLVLAGQSARYSRLWSEAFTTLARADAGAAPTLATPDPRPQQRAVICGVSAGASVRGPDGREDALLPDPNSTAGDCAAWWPALAGWQQIRSGDARLEVYVRADKELPGVLAQSLRDETARLVSPGRASASLNQSVPGPRWPWVLACLLASALGWALERKRRSAPPRSRTHLGRDEA
jgi:hypothetical protein